jgi:hypothetical protein
LGISFLIGYFIHFFQVFLFSKYYYGFKFNSEFFKVFFIQITLGISCFLTILFFEGVIAYLIGGVLISISVLYSIWQLNSRIGLTQLLNSIRNNSLK